MVSASKISYLAKISKEKKKRMKANDNEEVICLKFAYSYCLIYFLNEKESIQSNECFIYIILYSYIVSIL